MPYKNKEDHKRYNREYYKENRERFAVRWPEDYKKNGRKNHLKRKFGLTPEQFDEMVVKQSNKCAICGKAGEENRHKKLDIDHCHDTNKVRELLCNNCNQGIGQMKHDPILLEKAAAYLRKHRGEIKMNITNGVVEFERSVTPAQYEKKAAKVTLHFTVDEGEELAIVMARVADVAHAEVFALLRKPESSAHNDDAAREALQTRRLKEAHALAQDTVRQAGVTVDPRVAAVKTPPAPVVQEVPQENPTSASTLTSAVSTDAPQEVANITENPTFSTATVSSIVQITDAELTTICQRTTARMAGPEATKAVIAQFIEQPGMSVRTIPQEKRPAFVAALEALKRDEKVADY